MRGNSILLSFFILAVIIVRAQETSVSKAWVPDNGDGTYTNPVINADYSDPDAIRVGDDFYMISSSFNHMPGLPILHSKDLVNWKLIGHALKKQLPSEHFNKVQHGGGVWAPSIRFHKNEFYIYYPDPDFGIYLIKARSINGPWSDPLLVEAGKGLIDPCPLWDDNGKAYLVHAYAGSRAGFKSILVVKEMDKAGTAITGDPVLVYDGHESDPTIEGPKFHKRNNYYYIFAPAGGVSTGWQLVLRSRNIYGPYERKVVMDQGSTPINGPHQGAWVNTVTGTDWFLHFQDKEAYGRVVHLQPMKWVNDWPVIGKDDDGDGKGEPVTRFKKPVSRTNKITPPDSDEFNTSTLGLQWQWQANPTTNKIFHTPKGELQLFASYNDSMRNQWDNHSIIAQKLPAEDFTATTKLKFSPRQVGEQFGLILFGLDYAFIGIEKRKDGNYIICNEAVNADKGTKEKEIGSTIISAEEIYLRIKITKGALADLSWSTDNIRYHSMRNGFQARPGKWVGAKIGFFGKSSARTNDAGYILIDWFRIDRNN